MPRPTRIKEPGYIHHVICMGNNHESIFKSNADFRKYLSLLERAKEQEGIKLYNFVLMNNHVHMLVEGLKLNSLSRAIRDVSRNYAKYFNVKYHREGHVFQGRFKSILIQEERYFFCCLRYIDLNPVKALLVKKPGEYLWSGHRYLAYGKIAAIKLDLHPLYENIGHHPQERQSVYRMLMNNFQGEEVDLLNFKGQVLGDKDFVQVYRVRIDKNVPGTKGYTPQRI